VRSLKMDLKMDLKATSDWTCHLWRISRRRIR
jgi:hypothetical protein